MILVSVALFVLAQGPIITDFELPPEFNNLGSKSEHRIISGECNYVDDQSKFIHCGLVATEISKSKKGSTWEAFARNSKNSDDSLLATEKYWGMCDLKNASDSSSQFQKSFRDALRKNCAPPLTSQKIKMVFNTWIYKEKVTCNSKISRWEVDLKKIGKWQYISSNVPDGICRVIHLYTLESKDGNSWKYSETTVSVGSSLKDCKWIETDLGKKYEYSNEIENEIDLGDCKILHFGI